MQGVSHRSTLCHCYLPVLMGLRGSGRTHLQGQSYNSYLTHPTQIKLTTSDYSLFSLTNNYNYAPYPPYYYPRQPEQPGTRL